MNYPLTNMKFKQQEAIAHFSSNLGYSPVRVLRVNCKQGTEFCKGLIVLIAESLYGCVKGTDTIYLLQNNC